MEEDFYTSYLQGKYDEKIKWEKALKEKIEELKENINWINADESYYAIKVINDLLKINPILKEKTEDTEG